MFITAAFGISLSLLAIVAWQDLRLGKGESHLKA